MTKEEHNILEQIQKDLKRSINQSLKYQKKLLKIQSKLMTSDDDLEEGEKQDMIYDDLNMDDHEIMKLIQKNERALKRQNKILGIED